MIVKVDVTADDLKSGHRCASATCAGAIAMRRTVLAPLDPCIGAFEVWLSRDGVGHSIDLPEHADRAIADWDYGLDVEPFSFDLDVPDELLAGLL